MATRSKKTASKKKVSKKKVSKKKTKKSAASEIKVPVGFKPISGEFAPTWNPVEDESQPQEIIGVWGKERIIKIRRGRGIQEQRVVPIQTENEAWTLWCSAGLVALFDSAEEGDEVYIRYDGLGEAKPNQNPLKLFTTAIAENNSKPF